MIEIDGQSLTIEQFVAVARGGESACLGDAARGRVTRCRSVVERTLTEGRAVYGINTGFGELSHVNIPVEQLEELQRRLVLSHAAGVGTPLPAAAVRGMLLLRANTLARGHSGVRPVVIDALLSLLEADALPEVPSRGSVGASGDLAPLAHLALPLIGQGRVRIGGETVSAEDGLARIGLEPIRLEAKEGLALINGTQAMTSLVALAVSDVRRLVRVADLVGALSTEALRGTDAAFDPRLHELRPHPGQMASARNLWRLMKSSEIRESHREEDVRVQDPYSIRCMPQVHGAARDVLADVERKVAIEINAVTDNPLVFPESGDILSGGNFHGEPMAIAADVLAIGVAELGSISERRIEKLTNPLFSGLPAFLVEEAGLNSGFMIAQVTAAALVSENKGLCTPASVDSIPTSAEKEDHVSMGMGAALALGTVVENAEMVLAIELVAAAQGVTLLRPLRSGAMLERVMERVRERIDPWDQDREMAPVLAAGRQIVREELDDLWSELE